MLGSLVAFPLLMLRLGVPVPQSKPATFPQGAGTLDLSLEAISIQGQMQKGGSRGLPWLSWWPSDD